MAYVKKSVLEQLLDLVNRPGVAAGRIDTQQSMFGVRVISVLRDGVVGEINISDTSLYVDPIFRPSSEIARVFRVAVSAADQMAIDILFEEVEAVGPLLGGLERPLSTNQGISNEST